MAQKINLTHLAGKKILVAPLDWGLGHTTRCIPIIRELTNNGCKVWLAGEGSQGILLRSEFSHLPFLPLKGYRINYAAAGMTGKILLQVPKILRAIRYENSWLKERMKEYDFNVVIADNRYGLYHDKIHCIFITHQLCIKSPLGKWSEKLLQQWNYKFINHFSECWVPDEEGENNLADELSHPQKLPSIPLKYTGPLSRFEKKGIEEKKDHLLIILSGPEPQRTILENKIIQQIVHYPGSATVVRGLPDAEDIIPSTNSIMFYNHLPSGLLNEELEKAEYIIGRCGYSTVMDIAAMSKKSILIPTPGQTEQEYLAKHLMKKELALCIDQKEFSLHTALEKAKKFLYAFEEKSY